MVVKSISMRHSRRQHTSWLNRLLWVEPFWLLLLAPSLLFTEYFWEPALRPLLIGALFLFWPLRLKAEQALLPRGAAGWFLCFLLLWLPVTIWRSADSALSWEVAGYVYFALVSFVGLINWPPLRKQPYWLVLLLMTLGVALAVIGPEAFSVNPDKLLDVYQTEEFSLVDPTQEGETINPNILGGALALILPLGLALVLRWRLAPNGHPRSPTRWARWRWLPLLLWAPLLVMGNGLVLSQSRSSWLAVGIAILLLGWLLLSTHLNESFSLAPGESVTCPSQRRVTDSPGAEVIFEDSLSAIPATVSAGARKPSIWRRTLLVLFGGGLLVALFLFWRTGAVSTLLTPELQQSTQTSLTRRMDIWRLSLQMVGSNALTGIGLGNYEEAFTVSFAILPLTQGRVAPPHAHNLFLQLALDLGLLGLLAYLGLWIVLWRALLVQLHERPKTRHSPTYQPATQSVAIGVYSALVTMLIVGCFDNALWGTKLTFIPLCLFALAYISGEAENPNVPVT